MDNRPQHAKVEPYSRHGAWEFPGGLREQAHRALTLAERADAALQQETEKIRRTHGKDLWNHVPSVMFTDLDLLTTAVVVLSARAAEAFLNYYGVKRLRQTCYQQHCERLGRVPKLSVVVATCCNVLSDPKADIVAVATALSEARNRLVHPRTRELKTGAHLLDKLPTKGTLQVAKDSVADLERFFKLFIGFHADAADVVDDI